MARKLDLNSEHPLQHINTKFPPAHSKGFIISHRARTTISALLVGAVVFLSVAFAAIYADLNNTISNTSVKVIKQANTKEPEIVDPNAGKPLDILVLGQDTRDGNSANAAIGGASAELAGNHQADTTMVMHISSDRKFINIVSIPRDSLVSVPSCNITGGTIPARSNVMFNSIFATAYSRGGDLASAASCTMNAVNALTGLNISQFIVVDFAGLSQMIQALGGVDVCVPEAFSDEDTGLALKVGLNHLDGVQATQFARVRYAIGDGSDIMRTGRQQYLIKMLIREALNKNILTQTNQLYQLAKTALSSLNMSEGLAQTSILVGLANSLRSFKTSNMFTQTVPVASAPSAPGRVVWTNAHTQLWNAMINDQPMSAVGVTPDTTNTSTSSSGSNGTNSSSGSSSSNSSSSTSSNSASSNSSASSLTSSSNSSSSSSPTSSTATDPSTTPDRNTGLITLSDGTLIDPNTGGWVSKKDGVIHAANTGLYVGVADKYVNYTFCGISR